MIAVEEVETAKQYFKPAVHHKCSSKIEALQKELARCKAQNVALSAEINKPTFTEEGLVDYNFVKVHTGLPISKIVKAVFEHVSKTLPSDGDTKLLPIRECMCVLLKLKMNNSHEYLAYRFGISPSTVSWIFLKWLKQMDLQLSNLIMWPCRPRCSKKNNAFIFSRKFWGKGCNYH